MKKHKLHQKQNKAALASALFSILSSQAGAVSLTPNSNSTPVSTVIQGTQVTGPITISPQRETQCRSQAKEIAVQTYQSCLNDARAAQVEQLKKEYQQKLRALKTDYEKQIKSLKSSLQNGLLKEEAQTQAQSPAPTPAIAPTQAPDTTLQQPEKSDKESSAPANPQTSSLTTSPDVDPVIEPTLNNGNLEGVQTLQSIEGKDDEAPQKTSTSEEPVTTTQLPVLQLEETEISGDSSQSASAATDSDEVNNTDNSTEGRAKVIDEVPKAKDDVKELGVQEPQVILKPALPSKKPKSGKIIMVQKKADQQKNGTAAKTKKTTDTSKAPVSKTSQLGVAQKLPAKTKPTVTKRASQINTAQEKNKTAVIRTSNLEKSEILPASLSQDHLSSDQTNLLQK